MAEHARAHTQVESLALVQQANRETRPARHEPRSKAEQRDAWRQQAAAVLTGDTVSTGTRPEEMVASKRGAGGDGTGSAAGRPAGHDGLGASGSPAPVCPRPDRYLIVTLGHYR